MALRDIYCRFERRRESPINRKQTDESPCDQGGINQHLRGRPTPCPGPRVARCHPVTHD